MMYSRRTRNYRLLRASMALPKASTRRSRYASSGPRRVIEWGTDRITLPAGVDYTACKWSDGVLVHSVGSAPPAIYKYSEDSTSFTYLGSLPPGGASMVRFTMGYAWLISGKMCTILELKTGLRQMYKKPIVKRADLGSDGGWIIINAVYVTTCQGTAEIWAIMYRITEMRMEIVRTFVAAPAELIAHDPYGVIYRTGLWETLVLWKPGEPLRTFNPFDMLPRSSQYSESAPAYSVCTRGGIIRCLVAPGLQGIIILSTSLGHIIPHTICGIVSTRLMIVGDDSIIAHFDDSGQLVDVLGALPIQYLLTDVLGSTCRHRLASVSVFGSTGVVNIVCEHGHVLPVQLRAKFVTPGEIISPI